MQKFCTDFPPLNTMSIILTYISKSISLPMLGSGWFSTLCADLFEASRTISYVETISPKADTLHRYISRSDSLEFRKAFELQLRQVLRKLNINKVELAIDGKKDLYYGKNGGLNVRQIKHEHGADEAWEYIVISIVYPIRLPLMALPYKQGADIDKICIELLEYARALPLKIKKVLFDRGFYHGHLIDYLESHNDKRPLPYLIFVPQNDAIKNYIEQTTGSLGVFRHQMTYSREKSNWKPRTTIVVCKNVGTNKNGEPYHWVFATNLKPSIRLVKEYRKRWNIETGFRVMEEGKIKTKSNNPLVRIFYFFLRALFCVVWILNNMIKEFMTFKGYLRHVEKLLRIDEEYKPPPVQPEY